MPLTPARVSCAAAVLALASPARASDVLGDTLHLPTLSGTPANRLQPGAGRPLPGRCLGCALAAMTTAHTSLLYQIPAVIAGPRRLPRWFNATGAILGGVAATTGGVYLALNAGDPRPSVRNRAWGFGLPGLALGASSLALGAYGLLSNSRPLGVLLGRDQGQWRLGVPAPLAIATPRTTAPGVNLLGGDF